MTTHVLFSRPHKINIKTIKDARALMRLRKTTTLKSVMTLLGRRCLAAEYPASMRLKVRITVLPASPFNKPVLPPFQNCHFFACSAIRQGIKSSGKGSTNLRCTAASPSNVERIDSSEVESIWTRSAG